MRWQPYFGWCKVRVPIFIIGTMACRTAEELRSLYSRVVGHETGLYLYGNEDIRGERVAVCPGGGNILDVAHEMAENGIRNMITGVSIVNEYSGGVHAYERRHHFNVFGGTHYSSEKLAPMAMHQ